MKMQTFDYENHKAWASQKWLNILYFFMGGIALIFGGMAYDQVQDKADKPGPTSTATKEADPDDPRRTVLFRENFDDLDTSRWSHEIALGENRRQTFHVFENSRKTSHIFNGTLVITPLEINSTLIKQAGVIQDLHSTTPEFSCTSPVEEDCKITTSSSIYASSVRTARLTTRKSFSLSNGGKVTVRAKPATGAWLTSSIRLKPTTATYGPGIRSGMIDLMTVRGNDPLHYPDKICFENAAPFNACTPAFLDELRERYTAMALTPPPGSTGTIDLSHLNTQMYDIGCAGYDLEYERLIRQFLDVIEAGIEENSDEAVLALEIALNLTHHVGPYPDLNKLAMCALNCAPNDDFTSCIGGGGSNTVQAGLHMGPSANLDARSVLGGTRRFNTSLSEDYHLYSLEWNSSAIIHRVDDKIISYVNLSRPLYNCTFGLYCSSSTVQEVFPWMNCTAAPLLCTFSPLEFLTARRHLRSNSTIEVDIGDQAHAYLASGGPAAVLPTNEALRYAFFLNHSRALPVELNPYHDGPDHAPLDQSFFIEIELTAGGTHFPDNIGGKPWNNTDSAALANVKFIESGGIPSSVTGFVIDSILVSSVPAA